MQTLTCRPAERQMEEIDLIYEELLHLRAFSHLSDAVGYFSKLVFASYYTVATLVSHFGSLSIGL